MRAADRKVSPDPTLIQRDGEGVALARRGPRCDGGSVNVLPEFRNLDDFYSGDLLRQHGQSVDLGLAWHGGRSGMTYWSLRWLEATGEVFCWDLTGTGSVVVLAERLRRSVVTLLLGNRQRDLSLMWAAQAVLLPSVPDRFSGYVSQPERCVIWVVRDGWWERPLRVRTTPRVSASARVGPSRRIQLQEVAFAVLSDFLDNGEAGVPVVAGSLTSSNMRWPDVGEFEISNESLARLLRTACLEEIRSRCPRAGRHVQRRAPGNLVFDAVTVHDVWSYN